LKIEIHIDKKGTAFKEKRKIVAWLKKIAEREKLIRDEINIILSSDRKLLVLNRKFLNHDYLTDIITFDTSIGEKLVSDIFISIDRVEENAKIFKVPVKIELLRVMAHGILHLSGYDDHTEKEKRLMGRKEDEALEEF
jgi:probable rRNA maturation factor